MATDKRIMTVAQAAAYLNRSKVRVLQYISAGRIPHDRCGNAFILRAADVESFRPMKHGRPKKVVSRARHVRSG